MRKQRKLDLSVHTEKKPGEDDDDVRDNTSIKLAEKTMGGYVWMYVCVCMVVSVWVWVYVWLCFIYICVCVNMCVSRFVYMCI